MNKKKMLVVVSDSTSYDFDPDEYTEEEAIRMAWEWFNERKPNITITYIDNE